jgi:hypothetical protein
MLISYADTGNPCVDPTFVCNFSRHQRLVKVNLHILACTWRNYSNALPLEKRKRMKPLHRRRPSGITILACFELLGAITYVGLLFFVTPGSRDFIALIIGAALGFVVVYGLWTLQFWAFWLTAAFESSAIIYQLFLLTQPEYRNFHIVGPIFGIFLSAVTLGYIFLDRSVKPVFRRVVAS